MLACLTSIRGMACMPKNPDCHHELRRLAGAHWMMHAPADASFSSRLEACGLAASSFASPIGSWMPSCTLSTPCCIWRPAARPAQKASLCSAVAGTHCPAWQTSAAPACWACSFLGPVAASRAQPLSLLHCWHAPAAKQRLHEPQQVTTRLPHISGTRRGGPQCPFNNSGYLLNFVINAVTQCTVAAREQLAADPPRAAVLP